MKLKPKYCIFAFLAAAFQAFGMYHIHSAADITEGGVLGATLLLEHWFAISPALSSLLMNAGCYLLGWKTMGKTFLGYSLAAACGYSLGYRIWEQFPPLWPGIADYPLPAALIGALFIGIGAGICVRVGGATCGDDALAMSISRITKIPIQWVYLITDLSVLALSLTYLPAERILWSLLTVTLSGQIIGWIQHTKGEAPS
jgi:uncharacterized membrane-anchored protein YitT (DUF2179 family)